MPQIIVERQRLDSPGRNGLFIKNPSDVGNPFSQLILRQKFPTVLTAKENRNCEPQPFISSYKCSFYLLFLNFLSKMIILLQKNSQKEVREI